MRVKTGRRVENIKEWISENRYVLITFTILPTIAFALLIMPGDKPIQGSVINTIVGGLIAIPAWFLMLSVMFMPFYTMESTREETKEEELHRKYLNSEPVFSEGFADFIGFGIAIAICIAFPLFVIIFLLLIVASKD